MIALRLRAMRALLVVTVAEFAEYRALTFIWMMAGTLPIIMMFVWMSAAGEDEVAGYDAAGFARYFMLAFLVGQVTQVWVIWALDEEIRLGRMSIQLVRPIDPFWMHVAHNLVANGTRLPIALAVAAAGLGLGGALDGMPWERAPLFALSLVGAWLIAFNLNYALGLLSLWTDRAIALESWYYVVASVLAGQLFPLALLPDGFRQVVDVTPFPYIVNLPIEIMSARLPIGEAAAGIAIQWLWAIAFIAAHRLLWRLGLRRYGAVGA
jgi:ABC-2 type transport system permease protein